ncbi:MAG: flavin reductase family protein [Siculibacillus sp.]
MTTPVPSGGFPADEGLVELPLGEVYRYLEPGPVVLLTTRRGDRVNVMTMSWHMMVEFVPPRIACVVSDADHSAAALAATGECVIALPSADLVASVVAIGNSSGRSEDKFAAFGLTPLAAREVGAPLIAECFVDLECRVIDASLADRHGIRILEVVRAWRNPAITDTRTLHHRGRGIFAVDGETIRTASRMP